MGQSWYAAGEGLIMMYFVNPVDITESMVVSSNVVEDDYDEYSDETVYSAGMTVMVTDPGQHRIYTSLKDENQANQPEDNCVYNLVDYDSTNEDSPPWLLIGTTNYWGMFDRRTRTVTQSPYILDVTLQPLKPYSTLGLVNVDADIVFVTLTDSIDGLVYSSFQKTKETAGIVGAYAWMFYPQSRKDVLLFHSIPVYPYAELRIVALKYDGMAKIGEVVIGTKVDIGCVSFGYEYGITDYSTKTRDDSGVAILVEGAYSNTLNVSLMVDPARGNAIKQMLSRIRAKPTLYVGDIDRRETIIYAWYAELSLTAEYAGTHICNLDLEEL